MKTDLFDKTNKKIGTVELPDGIFSVKWNNDLVHQAFVAFTANQRKPWAHTKDRSEVQGGKKKPWMQKHTGRSRHGSTTSPIWVGGGITFGPRSDKDYSKKINTKMKRLALFSVLSKKFKDGNIKIVDSFDLEAPKTKKASEILKNFFDKSANLLIITDPKNKNAGLAFRNIPKVQISKPNSVNIYESLLSKNIFFEKEALEAFIKKYQTEK